MPQKLQKIKHFHYTHGGDVELHRLWNEAKRTQSITNGLVFTSKSVQTDQKIAIRLVRADVSDELPAIISIGFTAHSPSSLYCDLSKSTRSKLKRKSGFWICPIPKEVCTTNRVLFFYVNCNGEIKYGMDGEDKGTFDKKVDTTGPLWGLIDIWSPPTAIQLCEYIPKIFHRFSSKNVKITGNHLYKSFQKRRTSYAFTSRPLEINELVKIKFSDYGNFALGLTSCDPATLKHSHLPGNVESFLDRPEYWMVISDSSWYFKNNEEISYVITENGEMKIWKNRSPFLEVTHINQTQPLWGFFALCSVKSIEVTRVLSNQTERKMAPAPSAPELERAEVTPSSPRFESYCDLRGPQQPEASTHFQNEDRYDPLCVVCCEVASEAALIPCGHMCMCLGCARRQLRRGGDGHCPICRNRIQNVLKVYKS